MKLTKKKLQTEPKKTVSNTQCSYLLDYMEEHPELGLGSHKNFNSLDFKNRSKEWKDLSVVLNKMQDGAQKTPKEWSMFWALLKRRAKELKANADENNKPKNIFLGRLSNLMDSWAQSKATTEEDIYKLIEDDDSILILNSVAGKNGNCGINDTKLEPKTESSEETAMSMETFQEDSFEDSKLPVNGDSTNISTDQCSDMAVKGKIDPKDVKEFMDLMRKLVDLHKNQLRKDSEKMQGERKRLEAYYGEQAKVRQLESEKLLAERENMNAQIDMSDELMKVISRITANN